MRPRGPLETAEFFGNFFISQKFFHFQGSILKQNCFFQLFQYTLLFFFKFILKQICLFWLFLYTFETPKQNETKFLLVLKMNRNKRETDHVSVIFGLNHNFFFISFVDTLIQIQTQDLSRTGISIHAYPGQ